MELFTNTFADVKELRADLIASLTCVKKDKFKLRGNITSAWKVAQGEVERFLAAASKAPIDPDDQVVALDDPLKQREIKALKGEWARSGPNYAVPSFYEGGSPFPHPSLFIPCFLLEC